MTPTSSGDKLPKVALFLSGLVILVFVFCMGVFVGVSTGGRLPRAPFTIVRFLGPYLGLPNHGAIGTVAAIDGANLVIMDRLNQEYNGNVSSSTVVEDNLSRRITLQAIHIGDRIAVIGTPENGAINAAFIRLLSRAPVSGPFFLPRRASAYTNPWGRVTGNPRRAA